jgi:hypothetical protein
MAETREVFTHIEDASGEGLAYIGKAPGAAVSTDEQAPVLSALDGISNLQNIPYRSVGDADSDGIPGFSFKDSAGNLIRPTLNVDGTVPVSFASGTAASDSGSVTMAALNTEQDVIALAVAVDDVVVANMAMGSSFQPTVWVLYHDNNATLNELARFVTGPGDFAHTSNLSNIGFTAGATGTQRLVLRATQLRGALTDAHGTISLSNLG